MPGGDRTGPLGAGSMTGRGMGFYAGPPVQEQANPGQGIWGRLSRFIPNQGSMQPLPYRAWDTPGRRQRIFSRGFGFGRGRGSGFTGRYRRWI